MRTVVVAIAVVFALSACKTKQPAAREVKPPTAAEAETFGKEFATALGKCDAAEIDRLLDTNLVLARAVAHRSLRPDELRGLTKGLGKMGARICQEVGGQGVAVTFLRTRILDGAPRPLLRLIFNGDAGVNYYELVLDKRDAGVVAADIYVHMLGENISEAYGRAIDALMKTSSSAHIATVTRVRNLMREQKWEEARQQYETLPATLRDSKPMKVMEVQIASELGDDAYLAAMDRYAKAFPSDPSLALVQIDRLLLKKQYAETLAVLDQLDNQLGGDPYLAALRVDAFLGLDKPAEALAAVQRGIAAEPTLETLWWAQLTTQTTTGAFADALPTLETLRDKFGLQITPDLGGDERLTGLVASDVYKKWYAAQTN